MLSCLCLYVVNLTIFSITCQVCADQRYAEEVVQIFSNLRKFDKRDLDRIRSECYSSLALLKKHLKSQSKRTYYNKLLINFDYCLSTGIYQVIPILLLHHCHSKSSRSNIQNQKRLLREMISQMSPQRVFRWRAQGTTLICS